MENEEIIEEVIIDSVDEIIDYTDMDNTEQEIESSLSYSEDELVSALLHLINEQKDLEDSLDQEEEILLDQEGLEPVPLLVQSVDESIDYTDLLISLNEKMDSISTTLSGVATPDTLQTPLNEYNLTNILLVVLLALFGVSMLYKLIKDNLLHF